MFPSMEGVGPGGQVSVNRVMTIRIIYHVCYCSQNISRLWLCTLIEHPTVITE